MFLESTFYMKYFERIDSLELAFWENNVMSILFREGGGIKYSDSWYSSILENLFISNRESYS